MEAGQHRRWTIYWDDLGGRERIRHHHRIEDDREERLVPCARSLYTRVGRAAWPRMIG